MRGQFNASLKVQVQELKRTMQNRDKRRSSDQRQRKVRSRFSRVQHFLHSSSVLKRLWLHASQAHALARLHRRVMTPTTSDQQLRARAA